MKIKIKCINEQKLDIIINLLNNIGKIMSDTQIQIDELTAQVTKVNSEIITLKGNLEESIVNLEEQLANGMAVDLTSLRAAIDSIDNIVPDPVVV